MIKKRNIIVELTPLLDIILILLFFILVQNARQVQTAYYDMRDELEARYGEELAELRDTAEDYNELRIGLEEDATVVVVSIAPVDDEMAVRAITIEADGETAVVSLNGTLTAAQQSQMSLTFSEHLAAMLGDSPVAFIVFRFDSTRTYNTDRAFIIAAIDIQRLGQPNRFMVEIDTSS